jgi:transposase
MPPQLTETRMSMHRFFSPDQKITLLRRYILDGWTPSKVHGKQRPDQAMLNRWTMQLLGRGAKLFWPNGRFSANCHSVSDSHQDQRKQERDDGKSWMIKLAQGKCTQRDVLRRTRHKVAPVDIVMLLNSVRTQPLKYRNRAIAILSYKTGIQVAHIAAFLGVSHSSVDNWIAMFREKGGRTLLSPYTSDYRKMKDDQYRNAVFEILHAPPSCYRINRTTWRLQDIRMIMIKRGLPIGKSCISQIIKDAGYRYRKAKRVLTSTDPDYMEKLMAITRILGNLGPREKFFSVDEFGPFAVKIQGGKSLAPRGHARTIPQRQISKGALILTGALELSSNQMTHFYSPAKNSSEMIKLLNVLLEKYADQERIYFSWDAASWHASRELYARVDDINNTPARTCPRVELVPLPCCAQFLNVVESVFSGMARAVIHNSDYDSVPACKKAINRHFRERNRHFMRNPRRAGNKIWGKERTKAEFRASNNCKDPQYR